MPSLSRRREVDIRAGRLESEVRTAEFDSKDFKAGKKYMCERCGHLYQERSLNCPRCDRKTMGELRPIKESQIEEARRGAIRRAKARLGL